jgi:hypothetical protein
MIHTPIKSRSGVSDGHTWTTRIIPANEIRCIASAMSTPLTIIEKRGG